MHRTALRPRGSRGCFAARYGCARDGCRGPGVARRLPPGFDRAMQAAECGTSQHQHARRTMPIDRQNPWLTPDAYERVRNELVRLRDERSAPSMQDPDEEQRRERRIRKLSE